MGWFRSRAVKLAALVLASCGGASAVHAQTGQFVDLTGAFAHGFEEAAALRRGHDRAHP